MQVIIAFSCSLAAAGACDIGRNTQRMLCEGTNRIRAEYGLPPLEEDAHLDRMADDYAYRLWEYNGGGQGMALTHEIPGHEFQTRMKEGRVPMPAAENIAAGQRSIRQVLNAWRGSHGHLQNITGRYGHIGNGYYKGFWVQIFSR